MTASQFDAARSRVLAHEGGYADHPADPGGPTMKGVTQHVYDAWRVRHGVATRAVRRISANEIEAIYRAQYWAPLRADDLPAGLDYCLFDAAVNSGPVQAAKWLQRALGVTADGHVGEVTLAALAKRDVPALVNAICAQRLAMLKSLRGWAQFGRGWGQRVADVRAAALALATKAGAPPPPPPRPCADVAGSPRARPSDMRLTRTAEGAGGLIGGVGGVGAVVAEQADRLAPLADVSTVLKWAFAALMLAGIALTLAGAWRRIARGDAT